MTQYKIIVPLQNSVGAKETPHATLYYVEHMLAARFGGYTSYGATGGWVDPETSSLIEEPVTVVTANRLDSDPVRAADDWYFIQNLASLVAIAQAQYSVYVSHAPENVTLVQARVSKVATATHAEALVKTADKVAKVATGSVEPGIVQALEASGLRPIVIDENTDWSKLEELWPANPPFAREKGDLDGEL